MAAETAWPVTFCKHPNSDQEINHFKAYFRGKIFQICFLGAANSQRKFKLIYIGMKHLLLRKEKLAIAFNGAFRVLF